MITIEKCWKSEKTVFKNRDLLYIHVVWLYIVLIFLLYCNIEEYGYNNIEYSVIYLQRCKYFLSNPNPHASGY